MNLPRTEQPIAFINVGRVPANVEAEACKALACRRPRKLVGGRGDVIDVGRRYRLFRPCGATQFQLMTHERYNKVAAKNRNH